MTEISIHESYISVASLLKNVDSRRCLGRTRKVRMTTPDTITKQTNKDEEDVRMRVLKALLFTL